MAPTRMTQTRRGAATHARLLPAVAPEESRDAVLDVLWGAHDDHEPIFRDRVLHTLRRAHGHTTNGPIVDEEHVTKALALLSGPGEAQLVSQLCDLAGVSTTSRMGLYTLTEFFRDYPASYRRRRGHEHAGSRVTQPDLVVATVNPATDLTPETITPHVFVEAKGPRTRVSAGWGYCNDDVDFLHWSSQPSCLPHCCWLTGTDEAVVAANAAAWVWIGPTASPGRPWGAVPRPVDTPHAALKMTDDDRVRFETELTAAAGRWTHAALDDVAAWVGDTPVTPDVEVAYARDPRTDSRVARHLTGTRARHGYRALAAAIEEFAAR